MPRPRTLSVKGAQFIARFEGFRSHPYRDAVGVATIGYGHTHGVTLTSAPISRKRALELLREDAAEAGGAVNRLVKVKLTQNQFDALVSLVYNIGTGGFEHSTVLRQLNAGHPRRAALAFLMWDRGGGRVLLGLSTRRRAEARLFLKR